MLKTIVKKGSYHDSVVLMLLTNQISTIEGVKKVSIMMATPANKDIYRQSGLSTEELEGASANDMVVVADVDDEGILDVIMQEVVDLLHDEYGWSDSVSNLSGKLQRESLRYREAVELADVLGYDILWQKRRG